MQAGACLGMVVLATAAATTTACAPGEITTFAEPIDARTGQPDAATGQPDAATGQPDAATGQPDAAAGQPDAGPIGPLLGTFELTYYYVADELDYEETGVETTLYQPSCDTLATVPMTFADAVVIEGTGALSDGRVFNYTGPCNCSFSPCFDFVDADHPWGTGANDLALVPFRSIAVDRTVLTIGQRYYVAELDGVTMPGAPPIGGFVHDGCVTAADTGGHIIGMHIDFFSALRSYYLTLDGKLGLNDITLYDGGNRCP